MLVCNVSLRPQRSAIAADLAEAGAATDAPAASTTFSRLIDEPISASDTLDVFIGQVLVEAASASDAVNVGGIYGVAIDEPAAAADNVSAPAASEWAIWDSATVTAVTLSGGDLVATSTGTTSTNQGAHVASISEQTTGKYYFEATLQTYLGGGNMGVGVGAPATTYTNQGFGVDGAQLIFFSGIVWINSVNNGSIGSAFTGAVYGVAVDLDNRMIWVRKAPSGNWNGSGSDNPATNVGGFALPTGALVPFVTFGGSAGTPGNKVVGNFGDTAFTGTTPSGFTAGWPAEGEAVGSTIAADVAETTTATDDPSATVTAAPSGDWTLVDSWTRTVNVVEVDFVGLAGYTEVRVVLDGVAANAAGFRHLFVSTDNGSTFLNTSGDYIDVSSAGAETPSAQLVATSSGSVARSSEIIIAGWNLTTIKSAELRYGPGSNLVLIPTTSALNALRIKNSAVSSLTAGSIYVFAR